jgi:molybdenum cofactor guanylyltransferase
MEKSPDQDVTGVILVGGKSRRMGRDKAFLPWHGAPLFETVLSVFRKNFSDTLLVGGEAERFTGYDVRFVADIHPGSALGGLYTGLFHATTRHVFVACCDMPFPSPALLQHLCSLKDGYDCVVPETTETLEPLFAVYAKTALAAMLKLLQAGNLRVYDLYPLLRTRYVGADEIAPFLNGGKSLLNVNTPEEFALLGKR